MKANQVQSGVRSIVLIACTTLPALAQPATSRPSASPQDKTLLVFSIDQGFGNGIVVNRDVAAARWICAAIKSLRPKYEVCVLLNPQVADKPALETVLDAIVAEDVPIAFDVYSSDGQTLGTSQAHNAPADGLHGITISLENLQRYRERYGRRLAGLRFMEVFSMDFTDRAVRTTNPEWNTAGWKVPPDDFFQPALARPFLRFARDNHMFAQWSDWHWYRFASWDEPQKRHETAFAGLLGEFPGLVVVTYANNEPQEQSAARLANWHEAVRPFIAHGAGGIGLSDQAWLRDPETTCPPADLIAWAKRAIELRCRYLQFEPAWYFFRLPRGTFGRGDYTADPQWHDSGRPVHAFLRLRTALMETTTTRPVPNQHEAPASAPNPPPRGRSDSPRNPR